MHNMCFLLLSLHFSVECKFYEISDLNRKPFDPAITFTNISVLVKKERKEWWMEQRMEGVVCIAVLHIITSGTLGLRHLRPTQV